MTNVVCKELFPPLCASSVNSFFDNQIEKMMPSVVIDGLEHIRKCSAQDQLHGSFEEGLPQASAEQISQLNRIRVEALAALKV